MTLTRSAHPLARPEYDVGRLDPSRVLQNLSVVLKLSAAQQADRDALLAEIQRPGSPSYRAWLTPEQYAARFGAQPADVARVSSWLASQGLTVHEPSRLGARVTFTGTVAQIESAFQTEMHQYQVGGETHYAMARAPSVPADLGDSVLALYNAHDFYPRHTKPQVRVVNPQATCPAGDTDCNGNGIAPPDWSVIYDVGPLYSPGIAGKLITGAGVTIAIVGVAEISQTDLTAFRTRYGLAANPITMTLVPNTGAAQVANGAGLEAVLDTEWSGAIAPQATVHYLYVGAGDLNVTDAAYYAIEQSYGGVLSESFGGCEDGLAPADADVFEVYGSAANLEGITYLASTGDSGAAGCGGTAGNGGLYVNMPASYPGVTAVGGTGFAIPGGLTFTGGTVSARGAEVVWNEAHNGYTGQIGAGGGGISSIFSRPAYQGAITTCTPVGTLPTTVTAANQRQIPDVAFTAASGESQYGVFVECTLAGGDCTDTGTNPVVVEVGGTSASTPSFAGVVALANQATGGRLGNINPLLYALNKSNPTAYFHDITTGNNEVECRTADPGCPGNNVLYGYAATAGYDCASGLGSVDATQLVTAWSTLTPTTTGLGAAPTTIAEGGTVALTATVDGTASAPAGTVTFTFQSFLANGKLDLSWTLGEVALASASTTSSTAKLTALIPPGMVQPNQTVDVYAMYGGDTTHLPSTSPKQAIAFSTVGFCITPPTDSVAAGGKIAYAALGGVAPVRWYVDWDSTCSAAGTGCSTLDETTGAFVAGTGAKGYVIVQAVDADGAETFGEVTVAGGGGIVPWSAGPDDYTGIRVSASPLSACPSGDTCGTIPNGCGGTVSCGTCTAPQTCGGGTPSNPNQCGCTAITKCPAGDTCGTVSNGCGGTVSCGTCTAPETCGGGTPSNPNQCGCTAITKCPVGDTCGTVSNGCGGTVSCGTCTAPETCGGGTPSNPNQCGCTAITKCPAGDACGTVPNGCGGTVSCGACGVGQTCDVNTCVSSVADAGSGGHDSGTSGGQDSGTGGGQDSGAGGGQDSGTSAGQDSGASGGQDSGTSGGQDSGTSGGQDSGTIGEEDSGTTSEEDSGTTTSADSGIDSGSVQDGGQTEDGSPTEGGAEGGAASQSGNSGGCGCVTAGNTGGSTRAGMIGGIFLGLAALVRRRRSGKAVLRG